MHTLKLNKKDGRQLWLFSDSKLDENIVAPTPFSDPLVANPHLRWHPLRGEWVAYASYRQNRTFLPPPEYNPLAVTIDPNAPTELPMGNWQVAVFDNRFPSLTLTANNPPEITTPTVPAKGKCEVVVFTQNSQSSLGNLSLANIILLIKVWGIRTDDIGQDSKIQYVLPFENRGIEMGVTLNHPHGQIYAYPFIPPIPARMQHQAHNYFIEHGRGPLEDMIEKELKDEKRIIYRGEYAIAFTPPCARYPYEVWVAPIKAVPTFSSLTDYQRIDLAKALKTVLMKYDALWNRPFPYLMAWYQAPTDGIKHPESHLHAEFYPPYRTADKLKYLAGTEIAAGLFVMDALPEEKALELQKVIVDIN